MDVPQYLIMDVPQYDDIRDLGASLTQSIYDYYLDDKTRSRDSLILKTPVGEGTVLPDEIENKL